MKTRVFTAIVLFFILGISAPLWSDNRGVVVEDVGLDSAGAKAGIKPGDVLLSWEGTPRPPAGTKAPRGTLETPNDLILVEVEHGLRGATKITGAREGKTLAFTVPLGEWRIRVRPPMDNAVLKLYQAGKAATGKKEIEKGIALWREAAKLAEAKKNPALLSWLYLQIGNTWAENRKWNEALADYQAGIRFAEENKQAVGRSEFRNAMARTYQRQNDFDNAKGALKSVVDIWEKEDAQSLSYARALHNYGMIFHMRGDQDTAESFYKHALAIREKMAPQSLDTAGSLNNLGIIALNRKGLQAAEDYFNGALKIWEELSPVSLTLATCLNNLALIFYYRGDLDTSETYQKRALALREKIAPDSLDVAMSLNNLGVLARNKGDLDAAESYQKRALAIREKIAPDSLDVAFGYQNLGLIAEDRSDLNAAENFHRRALAIREKLSPGSSDVAASLQNLGSISLNRGDLEKAESYYRRALELKAKTAPLSVDYARNLISLGIVFRRRNELEMAEKQYKQALAVFEKQAPESLSVAACYNNLGLVAAERGNLDEGNAYYKKAVEIYNKLAPHSLDLARTLTNLGNTACEGKRYDEAEAYHRNALETWEKQVPGNLDVAFALNNLGKVYYARGDFAAAGEHLRRALAIWEKLAPGNMNEALSLHELGMISQKTDNLEQAAEYFRRSIEALEAQIARLGGAPEIKAGFRANYGSYYKDYIDLLLKLKKNEEAFLILERSRAQIFLAMLAERDLAFGTEVPEELELARKRVGLEYDRAQQNIGRLNPVRDKDKIEPLVSRLNELRLEQAKIGEQIRNASPKYASLRYPRPLGFRETIAGLDPGTVMLSYSIGKESSFLFVVTAEGGFEVHPLEAGEETLKSDIEKFQRLIRRGQADSSLPETFVAMGKQLYDRLLLPAQNLIEKSRRIVIVPDGPLHVLPFGALICPRQGGKKIAGRRWRYLVEWKPVHVTVSATVAGEIKKRRVGAGGLDAGKSFWAFGDPKYPSFKTEEADSIANGAVRSLAKRGNVFAPLPATRQEVIAISALFGNRAKFFLGEEATEERAKSPDKEVAYLHFACHGFLDEVFPLNSGLALTTPLELKENQDNGLLQAWEVFEKMRTEAELVVLSACSTALGKEMGGEGLVGLTRAFQYAGAKSVLASLWEVADVSTAEFMTKFYEYLKKGLSKDMALRAAQIDFIEKPLSLKSPSGKIEKFPASHPFFWAAFILIGDYL